MAETYKDKLKPVKIGGASYASKLKPIEPSTTDKPGGFGIGPIGFYTPKRAVKELSDFGAGVGSAIVKGGLGLGAAALKTTAAIGRVVAPGSGATAKAKEFADTASGLGEKLFAPLKEQTSSVSGKLGTAVGTIAPYLSGAGAVNAPTAALPAVKRAVVRTIPDLMVGTGQVGGDVKGTTAAGVTSLAANALIPGGAAIKTGAKQFFKEASPGYIADVTLGAAGQRGEDRTGAKALIPGAGTALGLGLATGVRAPGAIKNIRSGEKSAAIMQRVARLSKPEQQKFKQISRGEDVGEYLVNRGIYGNEDEIALKLSERFIQSKQLADDELARLPGNWKVQPVGTMLDDLVARETRISTPGATSRDLPRVTELLSKHNAEGLTMSEINEAKRLFERNIKLDFLRQNLPEGIARANTIDNAVRSWQFNNARRLGLENLSEINRETMLAKELSTKLGKEISGRLGNNAITLTDWVMLSGGDPAALAGFIVKKTVSSKNVQSGIARMLAPKEPVMGAPIAKRGTPEAGAVMEGLSGGAQLSAARQLGGTMRKGGPIITAEGSGRAIPVLPQGRTIEMVGPETVGGVYTPATGGRTTQQQLPQAQIETGKALDTTIPQPKESLINRIKNTPNKEGGFISTAPFKNTGDLTTKILKDLEGKTTVSKQYILDATNRGELKQAERDLTRQILDAMPDGQVNVADFAKRVQAELLPLKVKASDLFDAKKNRYGEDIMIEEGNFTPKYESVNLPAELRGKVASYRENIYESPIATSAGDTHFSYTTKNYFGHTRIEDMADNKTRRVIEVQSDLYQKGNPLDKLDDGYDYKYLAEMEDAIKKGEGYSHSDYAMLKKAKEKGLLGLDEAKTKLQQYSNPTAHFRMVREELKKAAQDGKTKLQFPTGETAMKIEGLGENNTRWRTANNGHILKPEELKVGSQINSNGQSEWIITDVLGDGKFKAVPQSSLKNVTGETVAEKIRTGQLSNYEESFDISGKVDTNNPIYKFYEKDLQKYLSKFDGKRVVDDKGVSWIEVPVKKEYGTNPVEAFGKAGVNVLTVGAVATGLGALIGGQFIKEKE